MASTPPAGSDQHTPNWDNFPNLDGVIQDSDIEYKGKVPYVRWMIIQAYLAQHAPGWHFALRMTCDPDTQAETPLYRSGDGTAYILGYFRAPKGSGFDDTPEVHYAVQDFKNNPIQCSKVSARDLTDADRRCRALAAATFFRLGWQLWTKDPFENPYREEEPAPAPKAAPKKAASSKKAVNTPPQADQSATAEGPSVQEQVAAVIRPLFQQHGEPAINAWRAKYKAQFKLSADVGNITGANITTPEQFAFTENFLNEFIKANPA